MIDSARSGVASPVDEGSYASPSPIRQSRAPTAADAEALRSALRSVCDALQPPRHAAKDSALFVGQLVGTQLGDPRDAFQVEERPRCQSAFWIPQLGSHLSLPHESAAEHGTRHAVLYEPSRPRP